MYATEIVNVRLGEIELVPESFRESVNISSNTITYRAQRVGAADFAGESEVTSAWPTGYGKMTVVEGSRVKKP